MALFTRCLPTLEGDGATAASAVRNATRPFPRGVRAPFERRDDPREDEHAHDEKGGRPAHDVPTPEKPEFPAVDITELRNGLRRASGATLRT